MKLKLLSAIVLAAAVAACTPEAVKEGPEGDSTGGAQVGGLDANGQLSGSELAAMDKKVSYERSAINDVNNVLVERVIYFDFDSDRVSPDFIDLVNHHGRYLAANNDVIMRLEGHGDERGTREYNVALGNRRAEAVKRLLMLQGAQPDQISVISYGEEKPVALDHDEAAWRLNRRVELVYNVK
ncbi:MAG: peptidoglycan-associated lipoprotein Pal [Gammaproteobacteria bacterium]